MKPSILWLMKKLFIFAIVACLAALSFVSCGNDDEGKLEGTWVGTGVMLEDYRLTLNSNGAYSIDVSYCFNQKKDHGSYHVKSDSIVFDSDGEGFPIGTNRFKYGVNDSVLWMRIPGSLCQTSSDFDLRLKRNK